MVTVYSSKSCGPCRQLKNYLTYKGFAFEDKDIDIPANARMAKRLSGKSIVPVTVVNNTIIEGYNLQHLNRVLGIGKH
jgi:glutaredoxin-like protein NrdH